LIAEAIVHCGSDEMLVVTAPIPDDCPYRLEHCLLEEDTVSLKEGWDEERAGK
jgi:hypothetical protein